MSNAAAVMSLVLAIVSPLRVHAQNLVPNDSFEFLAVCPFAVNTTGPCCGAAPCSPPPACPGTFPTSWAVPTGGTPDYFHVCGGAPVDVPMNDFGEQWPASGDAYAGLFVRLGVGAEYREYLEVPLISPLVANATYAVSFAVSLADKSQWAVDKIGAVLRAGSAGPVSNADPLPYTPQIFNPIGNFITEKCNSPTCWPSVSGSYVAAGGEDHLVIGNFYNDASTTPLTGLSGTDQTSYYYIDNVSVIRTCMQPPGGMVAWYPGDDSTPYDQLGFHPGTYFGSPVSVPDSMVGGGSLEFHGAGGPTYVQVPDHADLRFPTGSFSIDMWVKVSVPFSGIYPLIDKRNPTPRGYYLFLSDGYLGFQLADGSIHTHVSTNPNLRITDGNWHFVAVTVNRFNVASPDVSLYLDTGGEQYNVPALGNIDSTGADLLIGWAFGTVFNGLMDEVEFYERWLKNSEIAAIRGTDTFGKCKCDAPRRRYTLNRDFDNNTWVGKPPAKLQGVNHTAPNDHQLQLDALPIKGSPFPYAWIANSGEGTVSKVDTTTGQEVARYYTGPPDDSPTAADRYKYLSPSRTAVDLDGNCWVGNRKYPDPICGGTHVPSQASVTQILMDPGCTPTSTGSVALPWGQDCAVVRHYRVGLISASTGKIGIRALAVDRDGWLWAGHWSDGNVVKLDPNLPTATYAPIKYSSACPAIPAPIAPMPLCERSTTGFNNWGVSPYGLALSPNGLLYVSSFARSGPIGLPPDGAPPYTAATRAVLELDPKGCSICQGHLLDPGGPPTGTSLPQQAWPYGIAVDSQCVVWMADYTLARAIPSFTPRCIRWVPQTVPPANGFSFRTSSVSLGSTSKSRGRGITVHPFDDSVWMAVDVANLVAHFEGVTNPAYSTLPVAGKPVGIGVDINGDVIAVGQTSDSWAKLKGPGPGVPPPPIGSAVVSGGPQGTGLTPYSYSDLTGSLAALTTQQGFWTVIFDSGNNNYWGKLSWHSAEPPDSEIKVEVRVCNTLASNTCPASTPWKLVTNDVAFGTCPNPLVGQFLEIKVTFRRSRPQPPPGCQPPCAPFGDSPVLYDLSAEAICCNDDVDLGAPSAPCSLVCESVSSPCDSPAGAIIHYALPQVLGDCDFGAGVTCAPPSGSAFPMGLSQAVCTGYHSNGEPVSCAVEVDVTRAAACPGPTGACCVVGPTIRERTCIGPITLEECSEQQGLYLGDGTPCADGCATPCPDDCNDGLFCNGCESTDYSTSVCLVGVPSCGSDAVCDEAQRACLPPLLNDLTAEPSGANKNRFISFILPLSEAGPATAVRVRLTSLHHPTGPPNAPSFAAFEGQYRYLNAIRDAGNNPVFVCPDSAAGGTSYKCAKLGCSPEYRDWAGIFGGNVVHATGDTVLPSSQYAVSLLAASCAGNEDLCADASADFIVNTERWGNVDNAPPFGTPNAIDISKIVDKVKDAPGAYIEPRCQLREATPNPYGAAVNAQDIGRVVDAVKGQPYPFTISVCP